MSSRQVHPVAHFTKSSPPLPLWSSAPTQSQTARGLKANKHDFWVSLGSAFRLLSSEDNVSHRENSWGPAWFFSAHFRKEKRSLRQCLEIRILETYTTNSKILMWHIMYIGSVILDFKISFLLLQNQGYSQHIWKDISVASIWYNVKEGIP